MIPSVKTRETRSCELCEFYHQSYVGHSEIEFCSIRTDVNTEYSIDRPKSDKCKFNYTTEEILEILGAKNGKCTKLP